MKSSKEGMVDAFARAIRELRMCGIKSDELTPKHFLSATKGSEIKELVVKYGSMVYR